MRNFRLLAGAAIVALAALPSIASAQTAPAPADATNTDAIEDIVVVARRTSENLQSTPVAVSAFSGDTLANQQIVGIQQIQAATPNLTFSSAVAQPGSSTVFIRGQGSADGLVAIDQAVGVYIDGVYAARSTGGATDLVDVARVEVLRGPQGTLFGRNTTGGAINIIANRPTDEFEGSMRVDYGNFNTFLAQGVLNIPIAPGFAVRGAYQHRSHDGYGRTVTLNRPLGDNNTDFGRITFAIEPEGSRFSATLSADFSKFSNSGELTGLRSYAPAGPTAPTELLAGICGTQGLPSFLPPATAAGLLFLRPLCPALTPTPGPIANYVFGQNGNNDIYRTFGNTPSYGISDTRGASAVLQYEFSDAATLKSTTAWRGVRLESRSDNDGTPYTLSGGLTLPGNRINQNQFSQELQLSGDFGVVQYILGGFYFVENGTDRSDSGSLFPLSPTVNTVDGTIRNQSVAGYGQVIFNVTDALRLTGGLRYTEDKRNMQLRNRDTNQLSGVVTSSLTGLLNNPASDPLLASFERNFNYWSYLVSADWQATNDLFFYAKTSRSQRSGGLNTRAVAGGVPPVGFSPEIVTDYEVGAKIDLFDRHVRLNLAVFNSSIDDVQRNVIGNVGTRLVSGVANAAAATIRGGEAELTIAPVRGLRLGGTLGYTDARYDSFVNLDGADWSNAAFPYTPEWTVGAFADYSIDVGPGTLKLHADYSWRSEVFASPIQASAAQRVGQTAAQIQAISDALQATAQIPSYGLLNARVAFELNNPNIEIAVYARNITEEQYFTRLLATQNTPLAFTSYLPGDPQTYGVSVTYRF